MLVLPETTKYETIFNFIGAYTFIYFFFTKWVTLYRKPVRIGMFEHSCILIGAGRPFDY